MSYVSVNLASSGNLLLLQVDDALWPGGLNGKPTWNRACLFKCGWWFGIRSVCGRVWLPVVRLTVEWTRCPCWSKLRSPKIARSPIEENPSNEKSNRAADTLCVAQMISRHCFYTARPLKTRFNLQRSVLRVLRTVICEVKSRCRYVTYQASTVDRAWPQVWKMDSFCCVGAYVAPGENDVKQRNTSR